MPILAREDLTPAGAGSSAADFASTSPPARGLTRLIGRTLLLLLGVAAAWMVASLLSGSSAGATPVPISPTAPIAPAALPAVASPVITPVVVAPVVAPIVAGLPVAASAAPDVTSIAPVVSSTAPVVGAVIAPVVNTVVDLAPASVATTIDDVLLALTALGNDGPIDVASAPLAPATEVAATPIAPTGPAHIVAAAARLVTEGAAPAGAAGTSGRPTPSRVPGSPVQPSAPIMPAAPSGAAGPSTTSSEPSALASDSGLPAAWSQARRHLEFVHIQLQQVAADPSFSPD